PPGDEARLGRPGHLEADLERARHDEEHDGEDGEAIEAREHAAEHRPRLRTRPRRHEERGRDRRTEHQRATDENDQREVVQELEQVEIERLHGRGTSIGGISERTSRFTICLGEQEMPTYRDYFTDLKKRI